MYQEDIIEAHKYGTASFENLPQKIVKVIKNSKTIKKTLNIDRWWITQGRYEKYYWPLLFQYMNQCRAKKIQLYRNNRVQIISQIQHVQFINLQRLQLGQNKINNIQSLCFINFSCLQFLSLSYNQISQIKALKKLSVPSLGNYFSIGLNPLNQINALIKSQINSQRLNHLCLQSFLESNLLHQDLSCLIKISSVSVRSFYIQSNKRIKQVKVWSMLKLRFPDQQ